MLQLAMCKDKSWLWSLVIDGRQAETASFDPLDPPPANSKYQLISISSTLYCHSSVCPSTFPLNPIPSVITIWYYSHPTH